MAKRKLREYFLEMRLIDALATLALGIALVLLANSLAPFFALPGAHQIPVPFTSQAPQGNWSEPWQNACEETSILMVAEYYALANSEQSSDTPIDIEPTVAAARIREIIATKKLHFGDSFDESVDSMKSLIPHLNTSFTAYAVDSPSLSRIKYQLAQNRPIIVPVFAPLLNFPHYVPPADYHVLVLTGYNDQTQEFTLNDPGATRGKSLTVSYQTFMSAIHDLAFPEYQSGARRVLFTAPLQ